MVSKKPRIVIIGAGMAGLSAAQKLYTCSSGGLEVYVVEGGSRIGGRIKSSEFCGDRIELGATWIHGIQGSPLYKIAQERGLLSSSSSPPHQPWECMDGLPHTPLTLAEGGHLLSPSFVHPISTLFNNLINSIEGKPVVDDDDDHSFSEIVKQVTSSCNADADAAAAGGNHNYVSVASFLRKGLQAAAYAKFDDDGNFDVGDWKGKLLQEGILAMLENAHRSYTAVDDLETLDCAIEREYKVFPGDHITIAKGYSQVIESLASLLPEGMIQLNRKVAKIEKWDDESEQVKLHFCDGSTLLADHVIVTVSLGVLKQGSHRMFDPPLPSSKTGAISRLGFGVLNKVFLELPPPWHHFPFVQMMFHPPDSKLRNPQIPNWIRRSCRFYPIYNNSRVVLSWFVGKEAIEIESLSHEEIINGFSATASDLLSSQLNFEKVVTSQWGTDPLFLGSYSHVPIGSSGDDMDTLSEPLPHLKVLFAGEATHRTHYGTTHGAFISGIREANRLLQHYNISADTKSPLGFSC